MSAIAGNCTPPPPKIVLPRPINIPAGPELEVHNVLEQVQFVPQMAPMGSALLAAPLKFFKEGDLGPQKSGISHNAI